MEIYDFDQYEIGTKKYGGSDTKFSLEIDGIFYMLKQPTEIRNPTKIQEKYSNTCISEYLACHIYEILGFETQHTFLGNFTCTDGTKRLCVACEDFTDNPNYASEGLFYNILTIIHMILIEQRMSLVSKLEIRVMNKRSMVTWMK